MAEKEKTTSSKLFAWGELFGGMAIFGSATPVSKIVASNFPIFTGAALRMAVASAVLIPLILAQREQRGSLRKAKKKDWLLLALIALFGMFGFTLLMLFGMKLVSGVVGSIVMSTTPAITAVGAWLFLKDDIGWRKGVGIGLSVVGILVMHLANIGSAGEFKWEVILGSALVLAAVLCEAAYTLIGKIATDELKPLAIAGVTGAAALACLSGLQPLSLTRSSGRTSHGKAGPGRSGGARGRWLLARCSGIAA